MDSNYKIGDIAAYNASRRHVMLHEAKVVHVTATTITLENGRRFSLKTGQEMKSKDWSFPSSTLWDLAEAREHQAREADRRAVVEKVNALRQRLDGHRYGGGQGYRLTAEQLELIDSLLTTFDTE